MMTTEVEATARYGGRLLMNTMGTAPGSRDTSQDSIAWTTWTMNNRVRWAFILTTRLSLNYDKGSSTSTNDLLYSLLQAFRFSGCSYPKGDLGFVEYIPDEASCKGFCDSDGDCQFYEYNSEAQICYFHSFGNFLPRCNRIIGPSINQIWNCIDYMELPF